MSRLLLRLGILAFLPLAFLVFHPPAPVAADPPPPPVGPHLFLTNQGYAAIRSGQGGRFAAASGFSPTDNLPPGNGNVMISTQAFLIFWDPNNNIPQVYKDLLKRFYDDLGGTPYLNLTTQYYGNNGTIKNIASFGGTWTDTATAYTTYNGRDGSTANPLQDGDIRSEVDHALTQNPSWPTGLGNEFFVFTEKGIQSCDGGPPGANCTINITVDSSHIHYCAYHDRFTNGTERIYANMPYDGTWPGPGENCQNTSGQPNVSVCNATIDCDLEISEMSHELFESITDPEPNNTWTDGNCSPTGTVCGEIGDKCAYFFTNTTTRADGSNITLHGNPYNVQPEWSNAAFNGTANSGCAHDYQPASVSITKTGPGTVTAGGSFDYTISLTNNGSPTAETPQVSDSLDSHLQFGALAKPAGWDCTTPSVGSSGSISCHKTNNSSDHLQGYMNNGETANFDVSVTVAASTPNASSLGNTGNLGWDTKYTNSLSGSSSTTATVTTSADLAISKTDQGTPVAGSDFSYEIDVENNGPSDAQSATITDTLPAGMTFKSITGSGGWSCSGTATVTCTRGSVMTAGQIDALTLTVHIASSVADGTTLTNTASVSSTTSDPNTANNSASVPAKVAAQADLSITKTGPSAPTAGTDVTYTITTTNLGPSDAQSAAVSDPLPSGTTFQSISKPAGWNCATPSVGGTGTVTCTDTAAFAAGGMASFSLVVHLSASATGGSQLCNTATISTTTTDPVSSNNASQACGTVQTSADLALSQTVSTSGSPGNGTATFTLTLTNNGPSDSQHVSLVANLNFNSTPPPAVIASSGGTCTVSGKTVTCSWSSLAAGASSTVTITASWHSAVGVVTDSVTVTSGTPDPNANNNTSTVSANKK
jgi:uncharacterized repeat protein (TIGR01451 family)